MNDIEKFKEELPSKDKFYSSLTDRKISGKEYEHVLKGYLKMSSQNVPSEAQIKDIFIS